MPKPSIVNLWMNDFWFVQHMFHFNFGVYWWRRSLYGRGFIVLLAGGGIFWKPAASNTGSSSRTRPAIDPSIILIEKENQLTVSMSICVWIKSNFDNSVLPYLPAFFVEILIAPGNGGSAGSVGKNVAP